MMIRRTDMRKYSLGYAIVAFLVLLVFSTEANCFAGADDIKAMMKARKPTIDMLKSAGIVGEDNKGYLGFVTSVKKEVSLVNAENSDRKKVYSAIANQQGTSDDLVGQRRAKQIASRAKSGEWLQDGSGKWYKK
jgi:uncharacterized protein YdbL (DUF1318 family)